MYIFRSICQNVVIRCPSLPPICRTVPPLIIIEIQRAIRKSAVMESVNSRIDQNALPFNPSRVVLLSELSTRDKERYYTLLITHQAKFRRDSSQQSGQSTQAGDKQLFVADLRILAPGVKKNDYQRQFQNVDTGKLESFSWGREERIKRLLEDGYVEVRLYDSIDLLL